MTDHVSTMAALLAEHPVVLAPMEDVSDAPFRRVCRALGAVVCVTEFVRAEQLVSGSPHLDLWNGLRARYLGERVPQPLPLERGAGGRG